MKYATLLGLTILMASSPAAMAKVDRDCLRNVRDLGIPLARPSACVTPRWQNPINGDGPARASGPPYRSKAGIRFKRDVLCE